MKIETVTLRDGSSIPVSSLPDNIKSLIERYDIVIDRREKAQLDVVIMSHAARDLTTEISVAVEKHFQPKDATETPPQ